MTRSAWNGWAAIVAAGGLAAAAAAQTDEETGDEEILEEEIVVWGDRLEESLPLDLAAYGSRIEVVRAEQISPGGYFDLAQVLQQRVPGLYVAPKNGPFDYVHVSLQGSRSKDVLWLIDGVRISNRLYNTTTPLDTVPAHMVERIEVLKGGQSLFYGTQSAGGVINVVTRTSSNGTAGAITAGLDSNDGTHLAAHVGSGGGSHRFVVYGSNDDAAGFRPFREADYQPSATDRKRSYDVTTLGGRYRIAAGDDLLLTAQLQHTEAALDFATAEDRAQSFNERDEEIVSLKLDWAPSPRFDLFVKGYWHDWDSTFTRIDNDLANPGRLITISDHAIWQFSDYGLNLLGQLELGPHSELLLGYDHQSYEGRDDEFLIGEQTERVDALFGQVRYDFDVLDGLRLALGARHNAPSDGEETTVWNVAGEVHFGNSLYGRAQGGTSFRLPSAYELYVIDPCCEQGNSSLVGEESLNMELGLGGKGSRIVWEAMTFRRTVEDLIGIDFSLPDFPDGLIVNTTEEVEVTGFELIAAIAATPELSLTLDYTRAEAEEKGSGEQIQDVPLDLARLIVDWRSGALPLGVSLSMQYVGDVYDEVGGSIGRVNHGNYSLVELSGFYAFDAKRRHRVGVRVENVFDAEYDTRVVRVRRDLDGSSYAAGNLGAPRTLHLRYTFAY